MIWIISQYTVNVISCQAKQKIASEDMRVKKAILSFADHSQLVLLPLDHTPAPTCQFLYFLALRQSGEVHGPEGVNAQHSPVQTLQGYGDIS